MRTWISVKYELPSSTEGQWSNEVIALTAMGEIFKTSCIGSYWQRRRSMDEHDYVTHWMPLVYPD